MVLTLKFNLDAASKQITNQRDILALLFHKKMIIWLAVVVTLLRKALQLVLVN